MNNELYNAIMEQLNVVDDMIDDITDNISIISKNGNTADMILIMSRIKTMINKYEIKPLTDDSIK